VSSTPVTITVSPDASAAAASVATFVKAANALLSEISSNSQYDASTNTAGPLLGSTTAAQITQSVLSVFSTAGTTSVLGNLSAVGITEDKGTLDFNQQTFEAAYQTSPTSVQSLFTQGGTFSPASASYSGQVSLAYAGDETQPGTYSVVIDQSATQATDTGTVAYASGSSTVGSAGSLAITSGSQSVDYSVTAGQSLTQVASGLNQALAAAQMDLSAQVVTSGGSSYLQIISGQYGTAGNFSVTETGGNFGFASTATGDNVAGTINGTAATGNGQILAAPVSDPTLAGLSLQVGVGGISSATTIGSYTYAPGAAQQLASLATSLTAPQGQVTTEISTLQEQSSAINPEIAAQRQIVNEEAQMLNKTYDQLEVTLRSLQSESSSLASALGGLSSPNSSSVP